MEYDTHSYFKNYPKLEQCLDQLAPPSNYVVVLQFLDVTTNHKYTNLTVNLILITPKLTVSIYLQEMVLTYFQPSVV